MSLPTQYVVYPTLRVGIGCVNQHAILEVGDDGGGIPCGALLFTPGAKAKLV